MESLLNITCLPIIVGLVFVVMQVYKAIVSKFKNEIWTRLIPMWALLLGGALGVYIFFKLPALMIADDVLSALFVGFVSGLSAVGFNQIGKQLAKTESDTTTSAESVPAESTPAESVPAELPEEK